MVMSIRRFLLFLWLLALAITGDAWVFRAPASLVKTTKTAQNLPISRFLAASRRTLSPQAFKGRGIWHSHSDWRHETSKSITRRRRRWRLASWILFLAATILLSARSAAAASTTLAEAAAPIMSTAAASSVPEMTSAAATATANTALLRLPPPVPRAVELQLTNRLLFASLLGAAVGKERSSTHKNSAGVRTMALVALGACAFTICSSFGFSHLGRCDPSRMASNVASGVGFVGAGVITSSSNPKDSRQAIVHGLTTATAIWISAAIGVACGVGMLYVASVATISTIVILRFGRAKKRFRTNDSADKEWENWHEPQKQSTQQQQKQLSSPDMASKAQSETSLSKENAQAPLVTSTNVSLEEEEEYQDDEWDSHVETLQDDDEDEDEYLEEEPEEEPAKEVTISPSQYFEATTFIADQDVAEYHQQGQASILQGAHVASFGNFTGGLVSNTKKVTPQNDSSFFETIAAEEYLRRLEPPRRGSFRRWDNETIAP